MNKMGISKLTGVPETHLVGGLVTKRITRNQALQKLWNFEWIFGLDCHFICVSYHIHFCLICRKYFA